MRKYILISTAMMMLTLSLYASERTLGELSASLGLINVYYSEAGSQLTGLPNILDAKGGNVSVLSANIHYKFKPSYHSSWFLNASLPFISTSSDSYFSLGGGYEYYFSKLGSRSVIKDGDTSIKISPKFHYFVGGELNAGYLVYTTEEAQKNDTLLEFEALAGAVYAWKKKWAFRGQLSISKGVGIATSTFGVKAFVGGTYFLGD